MEPADSTPSSNIFHGVEIETTTTMTMLVLKTKAEFDDLIKTEKKLIVVDFFATWCGPCRLIGPKLEEMSKKYADVVFAKIDVDDNPEAAEACEISAMPTFHFYKEGKKVAEVVGASEAKIEEAINSNK